MSNNSRIVITTQATEFGGGERILVDLFNSLKSRGANTICLISAQASFQGMLEDVEYFENHSLKGQTAGSILIANDFDSLLRLARFKWKKRIFICHGPWQLTGKMKLFLIFFRIDVFFVSSYVKSFAYSGLCLNKNQIHDLGYAPSERFSRSLDNQNKSELRKILGIPQASKCVVTHSRFHESKRLDLFVNSVLEAGMTPVLSLIGGPKLDVIRERLPVHSVESGRNAIYVFEDIEPLQLLGVGDIYLCTSKIETLGVSLMEAEKFGIPIVTTAQGGTQDYLYESFNCIKVFNDDPKDISQALIKADGMKNNPNSNFPTKRFSATEADSFENVWRFLNE